MKRIKKRLALALAALMLLACFVGCSQDQASQTKTTTSATTPTSGEDNANKALEDYTEMMKLSPYMAIGTASPADPVNNKYVAYVRDKFKIDMSETEFVSSPEWAKTQERLGLMISSGEMPDAIPMWVDANTLKMAQQFIDAGMVLEVGPYIDKMTNLKQDLSAATIENFTSSNGKLYMLPSFAINPDNKETEYTMEPNLTLVKRTDVWEELGITENPKTPDELYEVLKKLKTVGDVNGKTFIPFQGLMQGGDFETMFGGMFGIWTHRGEVNEAEKRFTYMQEYPEYLEFLKYGSKLFREGLIDPEMFINGTDIGTARFKEGRVGSFITWPNDIDTLTAAVKTVDPDGMYNAFPIPKAPGIENTEYWHTTTLGAMITLVNKDVADPDRVMKFIDWNVSKEGWMAQCYGGPGENENDGVWHITPDGKYYYNTEFINEKNKEDPTYMAQCGGWVYFLAGRLVYHIDHQGFDNITESPDAQRMEAREYNLPEVFIDQEYEKIISIPAGPVELAKFTAVNKVLQDGLAKIISTTNSDAEVEAAYNQMIEDVVKAGQNEIMEERYERYQLSKKGKLDQ